MIDFGLSYICLMDEDKAVDLYVLERAIQSTHPSMTKVFDWIRDEYQQQCPSESKCIISKLEEVRLRGRKRSMIG